MVPTILKGVMPDAIGRAHKKTSDAIMSHYEFASAIRSPDDWLQFLNSEHEFWTFEYWSAHLFIALNGCTSSD